MLIGGRSEADPNATDGCKYAITAFVRPKLNDTPSNDFTRRKIPDAQLADKTPGGVDVRLLLVEIGYMVKPPSGKVRF